MNFGNASARLLDSGFSPEDLLPVIPPGAELSRGSKIKRDQLGKIPGRYKNGWWSGIGRYSYADPFPLTS
jgi:hypothetical protein